MRGDTHPVASGTGDGTRICSCGEGLAGACRGNWGECLLLSTPFPGLPPHRQSFAILKLEQAGSARLGGHLPQSDLRGSCLQASGNPIHSEEPEPAAAFPLAICKSVKYSCGATCESRLTPLSVSLLFPSSRRQWLFFLRELQRWHTWIFSLASGSP